MKMLKLAWLGLFAFAFACSDHAFVSRPKDPPSAVVFRAVTLFDARNGVMLEGPRDVLVKGDRIAEIAAHVDAPGAREVTGGGVLLPGLIDLHVHHGGASNVPTTIDFPHPKENLTEFLYTGVTSVLDVGSMTPDVFETRDELRAHKLMGPDLFAAGPMFTAPGGHPVALLDLAAPPMMGWWLKGKLTRTVATPEEARAEVRKIVAEGHPDVIKVAIDRIPKSANRIDAPVLKALCDETHQHGIRVVAHIGSSDDAIVAAENGVDALVHGVYTEAVSDAALDALVAHKVSVVPTLSVWRALLRFGDEKPEYTELEKQVARPDTMAALIKRPVGLETHPLADWLRELGSVRVAHHANVAKMIARGIPVLVGSDSANVGHFPGAGLHLELDEMAKTGLPPLKVLQAATWLNARFLHAKDEPDVGVIEAGKRGDLVLIGGDPTTDISRVHDLRAVMKDGVLLERHPRP